MRLNYWLRTARRVHHLSAARPITSPDKLTLWLKTLPWEEWISPDGYFSVTSLVDHPAIENDQYANLVVKDAIAERIRFKEDVQHDSGPALNKSVIFLF